MQFTKSLKRIIIALIAIITVCAIVPFATNAADSNVKQIFDFLVNDMKLTPAAACGVLANIEYESDFDYNCVGDNGTSYGICQWHNERLTNMKNYCSKNGYSYKSLEGQLNFLKYELSTNKSDTGYILDKLSSVANSADGAYTAGYNWCCYFERPANKTAQSENRGAKAKNTYWPKYGTAAAATATKEAPTTTKAAPTTTKAPSYSIGDINKDDIVNSSDALLAIEHSTGARKLSADQIKLADITKDGKVTSSDAVIILNIASGTDSVKNFQ